jgi:hypothetical protein
LTILLLLKLFLNLTKPLNVIPRDSFSVEAPIIISPRDNAVSGVSIRAQLVFGFLNVSHLEIPVSDTRNQIVGNCAMPIWPMNELSVGDVAWFRAGILWKHSLVHQRLNEGASQAIRAVIRTTPLNLFTALDFTLAAMAAYALDFNLKVSHLSLEDFA